MSRRLAQALLDSGDPFEFVRRAHGGKVHVVAPAAAVPSPWLNGEEGALRAALNLAWGPVPTVCGKWVHRNAGGLEKGGYFVDYFPDDDLCWGCCLAFPVDQRFRIFKANVAPLEGSTDGA